MRLYIITDLVFCVATVFTASYGTYSEQVSIEFKIIAQLLILIREMLRLFSVLGGPTRLPFFGWAS